MFKICLEAQSNCWVMTVLVQCLYIQYSHFVCRPGYRDKLRYSQAELGQAIKSAVAYFPSISWGATGMGVLY